VAGIAAKIGPLKAYVIELFSYPSKTVTGKHYAKKL
jgi:hypothetical protein